MTIVFYYIYMYLNFPCEYLLLHIDIWKQEIAVFFLLLENDVFLDNYVAAEHLLDFYPT